MPVLVVGSIGIDTVETPHGRVEEVLGGSGSYFSYAASFFGPVRLVGVVGEDLPRAYRDVLSERGVDLAGLTVRPGKTFRWTGRYSPDMNDRETVRVELNVFAGYEPAVPSPFRDSKLVFLANGSPKTQSAVLDQMPSPGLVMADTMNLWIDTERDGLLALLARVDGVVLNDSELRQLTGSTHLIRGARQVLAEYGPRIVIVKKGEHGALLVTESEILPIPSFPVEHVVDPTGAGDAFAGGFMGALREEPEVSARGLKRALLYGTVMASFTIEGFSLDRLRRLTRDEIDERAGALRRILDYE